MTLTEQQVFMLINLVQEEIFRQQDPNIMPELGFNFDDFYALETELFAYQTENF